MMESLHVKQARVYEKKGMVPVGIIKFNKNVEELISGTFFLPEIKGFRENGRCKIKDSGEGFIELQDYKKSYEDLISNYSNYMRTYSCSFTVLFNSDFDITGKIKRRTVNKLLNLDYPIEKEQRDAAIFMCKKGSNIIDILGCMGSNTPEFINQDLKKPSYNNKKKVQEFHTGNFLSWRDKLIKLGFTQGVEYLMEPCINNNEVYNFFKKQGLLEQKNKRKIGFKGSYVYYGDLSQFEDEIKQLNRKILNIKNTDTICNYEKLLQYCFFQKSNFYEVQHEYRILLTQFNQLNEFPSSVKLTYEDTDSSSRKWWAKKIYNENVSKLSLSDFDLL